MMRRRFYHERLYIVIIVIVSYSENEKHTLCTAIFLFRVLRMKHSDKNVLEESLAGCDYTTLYRGSRFILTFY